MVNSNIKHTIDTNVIYNNSKSRGYKKQYGLSRDKKQRNANKVKPIRHNRKPQPSQKILRTLGTANYIIIQDGKKYEDERLDQLKRDEKANEDFINFIQISYKEEIEYERRAKEEKEWRMNEFVDAWIRRNKAFERMKQRAQEELANTYPEDEESFYNNPRKSRGRRRRRINSW